MGLEFEHAYDHSFITWKFLSVITISCPMLSSGRPGLETEVTVLELNRGMAARSQLLILHYNICSTPERCTPNYNNVVTEKKKQKAKSQIGIT